MSEVVYVCCPLCGWWRVVDYELKADGKRATSEYKRWDFTSQSLGSDMWQVRVFKGAGRGRGTINVIERKGLLDIPQEFKDQIVQQCTDILQALGGATPLPPPPVKLPPPLKLKPKVKPVKVAPTLEFVSWKPFGKSNYSPEQAKLLLEHIKTLARVEALAPQVSGEVFKIKDADAREELEKLSSMIADWEIAMEDIAKTPQQKKELKRIKELSRALIDEDLEAAQEALEKLVK